MLKDESLFSILAPDKCLLGSEYRELEPKPETTSLSEPAHDKDGALITSFSPNNMHLR